MTHAKCALSVFVSTLFCRTKKHVRGIDQKRKLSLFSVYQQVDAFSKMHMHSSAMYASVLAFTASNAFATTLPLILCLHLTTK